MSTEKIHPLIQKYMRMERMPFKTCPGCGIGQILHSTLMAMEELGLDPANTVLVQGVGCSSRLSFATWKGDSIDAHHGRIFAVSTGMKMSRPELNFILFTGDGDCAAIGGNHFIHACRRNLDVTAILFNNGIYGLTGGQVAPTTPLEAKTTTSPYGNLEPLFDMCELAATAGASYVARWKATQVQRMANSIKKGIQTEGLAFIEGLVQCPTQFGRYVLGTERPAEVLEWIDDHSVSKKKAEKMSEGDLEGKYVLGELTEQKRPGYVKIYHDFIKELKSKPR